MSLLAISLLVAPCASSFSTARSLSLSECKRSLNPYRYTQLSQINVSYCIFDKGRDRFGVGGRGITRH